MYIYICVALPSTEAMISEVGLLFKVMCFTPESMQVYKDSWNVKTLYTYAWKRYKDAVRRGQTPRVSWLHGKFYIAILKLFVWGIIGIQHFCESQIGAIKDPEVRKLFALLAKREEELENQGDQDPAEPDDNGDDDLEEDPEEEEEPLVDEMPDGDDNGGHGQEEEANPQEEGESAEAAEEEEPEDDEVVVVSSTDPSKATKPFEFPEIKPNPLASSSGLQPKRDALREKQDAIRKLEEELGLRHLVLKNCSPIVCNLQPFTWVPDHL